MMGSQWEGGGRARCRVGRHSRARQEGTKQEPQQEGATAGAAPLTAAFTASSRLSSPVSLSSAALKRRATSFFSACDKGGGTYGRRRVEHGRAQGRSRTLEGTQRGDAKRCAAARGGAPAGA